MLRSMYFLSLPCQEHCIKREAILCLREDLLAPPSLVERKEQIEGLKMWTKRIVREVIKWTVARSKVRTNCTLL